MTEPRHLLLYYPDPHLALDALAPPPSLVLVRADPPSSEDPWFPGRACTPQGNWEHDPGLLHEVLAQLRDCDALVLVGLDWQNAAATDWLAGVLAGAASAWQKPVYQLVVPVEVASPEELEAAWLPEAWDTLAAWLEADLTEPAGPRRPDFVSFIRDLRAEAAWTPPGVEPETLPSKDARELEGLARQVERTGQRLGFVPLGPPRGAGRRTP